MTTGTIVYLANAQTIPDDFDVEGALAREGLAPETSEVAASAPGYYRVDEALLALVRRGAGRVSLVRGRLDEGGGLTLRPERLHLHG